MPFLFRKKKGSVQYVVVVEVALGKPSKLQSTGLYLGYIYIINMSSVHMCV